MMTRREFVKLGTIHGEDVYAWELIAPKWYWFLRRLKLFLGIVWRNFHGARIGWMTAWHVSQIAIGRSK